jgi:hypothetical protein
MRHKFIVLLLSISATANAGDTILCSSDSGREDVTIIKSADKLFGKTLDCLSGGDFIADLTPCAPNEEFALSAPTGSAAIVEIVQRWQDYTDHLGGVTSHYITDDVIAFSGGWNSPENGYTEQWSFEANRLTGVGTLCLSR